MTAYPTVPKQEVAESTGDLIYRIPRNIRPKLARYRMELMCWGLRALKSAAPTISLSQFDKVRIELEVGNTIIKSESLENYKKQPNFQEKVYASEVVSKKM